MLTILQAESIDELEIVRSLLREYQSLLGVDLGFQDFEAELKDLPGNYATPSGRLLLAMDDGTPVGCVALRPIQGPRCEMKRLFVRPGSRGLGVGRGLVARVLEEARAVGYSEMVLDTLPTMAEAQKLYSAFGFREIAPYRANPIVGIRYLGCRLERA